MTLDADTEATPITFHVASIDFEIAEENKIRQWIQATTFAEHKDLGPISIIFCSDEYLLEINKTYLDHDYFTDIISFPYSKNPIEGDIYISIDRIRENAKEYHVTFDHELHRVIIHGILHFLGYRDKTEEEQNTMTTKEDYYLSLLV